jgi:hypothetical protein
MAEPERVVEFRKKMQSDEAKAAYRQRGAVAEFPNAWIKQKMGLRKFHLSGLIKAGIEVLWACLAYNAMQYIRLMGQQKAEVAIIA